MDGNTKAIAEALRRWYEAPKAKVIDLASERRKRAQQSQPLRPTPGGRAA